MDEAARRSPGGVSGLSGCAPDPRTGNAATAAMSRYVARDKDTAVALRSVIEELVAKDAAARSGPVPGLVRRRCPRHIGWGSRLYRH